MKKYGIRILIMIYLIKLVFEIDNIKTKIISDVHCYIRQLRKRTSGKLSYGPKVGCPLNVTSESDVQWTTLAEWGMSCIARIWFQGPALLICVEAVRALRQSVQWMSTCVNAQVVTAEQTVMSVSTHLHAV